MEMTGVWFVILGLAMFLAGGAAAWSISKTVIQFIEDMHEQKTKSIEDDARIDALESKNEVQSVRLMIKEMEDLHRTEIGMYQDRVADLESELEKQRAEALEQVETSRKQLNRMKKRHKRATQMYNASRKAQKELEDSKMLLVSGYTKRLAAKDELIAVRDAEILTSQRVIEISDAEAERAHRLYKLREQEIKEDYVARERAEKKQIQKMLAEFQQEKTALHKKIKRINSRRKYASKIHMGVLQDAYNRGSDTRKEVEVLKKKLEDAANVIMSLRNTR